MPVRRTQRTRPSPELRLAGADGEPAEQLRAAVQRFVRGFGLLASDRTPCGTPLSTSHAHALMVLLDHGIAATAISQQTLGAALGIDKSNVARLCARMEREGHLTRRDSPTDGRARALSLTAAGRRLAERVDSASRGRFEALLAALPTQQVRREVLASLDALNTAIVTSQNQEPPP